MLGRDRVVGSAHLEEHTPILEQGGARMIREELLQQTGEFRRGEFRDFHLPLQPVLPAHARRQLGNVRCVVAAVPIVDHDQLFDETDEPIL